MVNTIKPPLNPVAETQAEDPKQELPGLETLKTLDETASLFQKQPGVQPPQKLLQRFEHFLVPALILFLVGNVLAYALPDLSFAKVQIGLPLLLVFAGIIFYSANKPGTRWVIRLDLWMMILIIGSLHYTLRQFEPGPTDVSQMAPLARAEVMGVVLAHNAPNRVIVQVSQVNRKKVTGQLLAYLPQDDEMEAGRRLLLDGELFLPSESQIPGAFNQNEYLKSQHITALLKRPSRIIGFETSNQPQYALQRMSDHLKRQVLETFAKSLPSPQSAVLGGIVLGDKAIPVDRQTRQAFIQTGLIHVLAASGMNVGIIAGALLWLLSALKVSHRKRFAIAMAAVAFYSLLTGLPPSIQRATAMLELALLLKMLNRQLSPVFLLCVASALLVLVNPENIASIGFQFSVLTTFGLLSMLPPLQEALGYYITRRLAGLILVPLVAQLWIWPLSVAYFNQFPIHTIPLNIAALVMVTPLTIIGFTAGIVSLILPAVGGWISWLARPFLDGLLWVVHSGSDMTWAQWSLPSPEPWQIACLYLGMLGILLLMHQFKQLSLPRKSVLGLLPFALLLGGLCLENGYASNSSRIDLLPLSRQREALLIQPARANANLVITPETLNYYEARALADYLKHRHITRLGAVLLLPETEAEGQRVSRLKTAFQQSEIGLLLFSSDSEVAQEIPAQRGRFFPSAGGQLEVGSLKLEGTLGRLRIVENRQCLVQIDGQYQQQATVTGCGVQAVLGAEGSRLFSQENLSSERFYHLVH